jgi:hypothetical protein
MNRKFSPPRMITWLIAVVLGVIGLLGYTGVLPIASAFWFVAAAFIILAVATMFEGF